MEAILSQFEQWEIDLLMAELEGETDDDDG